MSTLPLPLRRRAFYLWVHREVPRFGRPAKFSEKVNWRILHDRRPELGWTCDKQAMKDHAGVLAPDVQVPRTLWFGTDLADLADVELPGRWVLKANHRSQTVHFGSGPADVDALRGITRGWMGQYQGDRLGEWAYTQARRAFLVEEWIGDGDETPPDFKFFVFDGRPHYVQVDVARFSGHQRRIYTADWEPLDTRNYYPLAEVQPKPDHLAEMLDIAGRIGSAFEFLRVDLYDTSRGVFFGESTPYPGGGIERFRPPGLDVEMGRLWRLPDLETR